MIIEAVDVYLVTMPIIYPFRTAFGNDEVIESVLLRLESGGAYGWGEACPWALPAYSPEYARGVYQVVSTLFGRCLVGRDVDSGEELQRLLGWAKGNRFAKAGLDMAWWDLRARMEGTPLYRLLGGERQTVTVGADFGIMETVDDLLKEIEEAVASGFARVKLKYRPGWELNMLEPVRRAFPETVFHVDCNSAYTLDDLPMLKRLDDFDLAMVEQPLMHDDLLDHATLQAELRTPICLDESITSRVKARQAIELGACGYINIKPPRVGGLTEAMAIHDLCAERGIPCWVGGMLESAVGASHCLALATLPNFTYPADIFPSSRFFTADLGEPEMVLSGPSQATVRETPGCGVEPHPDRLARQMLEHCRIEAD